MGVAVLYWLSNEMPFSQIELEWNENQWSLISIFFFVNKLFLVIKMKRN